jgi:malate dehydrogenase (oxaloacetate-decarboxylating)
MAVAPVTAEEALALGREVYHGHGKIEILPKVVVKELRDIAVAFTPGVGHVVRRLAERPEELHEQTAKDNLIALVTDGTAVLGLGNVGPRAGMPVMEGKAVMFKLLAGVDCMPLCLDARGPDHLVDIITALEPSFGGFNLEDVAAPACFEVMRALDGNLPVPILHDDQFGTATVITAALLNALEVTGRAPADLRAVVNGVGAAGSAAIAMMEALGVGDIVAVDRQGVLHRDAKHPFAHWQEIAGRTNQGGVTGGLAEAMRGADVFIGLSVGGLVDRDMVRSMAKDPIVFALANPHPEILPNEATAAGAALVASGRFDFPNHCNNVLAFPALIRGALDAKARRISRSMCLAAAWAIADLVPAAELSPHNILPSPLQEDLYPSVAESVAQAAVAEGLARVAPVPGAVAANTRRLRGLVALRQEELGRLLDQDSAPNEHGRAIASR